MVDILYATGNGSPKYAPITSAEEIRLLMVESDLALLTDLDLSKPIGPGNPRHLACSAEEEKELSELLLKQAALDDILAFEKLGRL